jgi:hypothetical protein
MAKVEYKPSSPYFNTPQTTWYLGTYEPRDIGRDGTDNFKILESKYEHRPDLLSYDLYGSPNFWWVFMMINPDQIKDPIFDLKAGMTIWTPTATRLSNNLGV